jgi:uncharacterized protein
MPSWFPHLAASRAFRIGAAIPLTGLMSPRFRAALITGSSSGIGEAFARAIAAPTALLLTGRNEEVLRRLSRELGPHRLVEMIAADLTTEHGLNVLCAAAERLRIDLLICNAGVGPFGDFLATDEAALSQTVAVNILAPVILIRRLLPGMLARAEADGRRAGLIVVSSNTAFLPVPRLAAYAASKAFGLSLAEALAAELAGQPIDVLALCPTVTRTRFAERSGFGRVPPLAQSPAHVARRALAALGRERTLVLGPISGSAFTFPALFRAAAAQMFQAILPRR